MWMSRSPACAKLRAEFDAVPIIETHEHYCGICAPEPELDVLRLLAWSGYYASDLQSASADFSPRISVGMWNGSPLIEYLADTAVPFGARYAAWRKYHDRICHTGYARALFEGLRVCWDLASVEPQALLAMQARMRSERNQAYADQMLAQHGIRAMVVNTSLTEVLSGRLPYREGFARFVLDLPQYHDVSSEASLRKPHLEEALGRKIITLDDYLEGFSLFLDRAVAFGIVGLKDQSAYQRCINYDNPTRAAAEGVFNHLIAHPRETLGTAACRPLDDYLFNQFLRLAARRRLPVQIHTGHMAGIRNEIAKTNPVHLTPMLELHSDVTFDLFHGGWPYLGEYLFLGKNYPNVNLDLCWANAIDPAYCVEFFKRAVMTVPHTKVMGFGGDTHLFEMQIGSAIQARDNIAIALGELVDSAWLSHAAALDVARAWLFENPNRLFGLNVAG